MSETNKEAVKTLALAVGVREAARQLKIPENTLLSWSRRDNWFPDGHTKQPGKERNQSAITPSKALNNHLEQAKHKTRSNLAKFTVNASKVAARSRNPLADAGKVKDLATVMEKVWPEEKSEAGINLNVLSIGGDMAVQVNQKAS